MTTNSSTTVTSTPIPTSKPITSSITLSNGVILHKPLNRHAAWARVANIKLGLGMIGINLIDIITTLCLKDISSVCPDYVMPHVELPSDVLALDASMDILKAAYKPYAEIYCNIPLSDWKIIKTEIAPHLDSNMF